MLHSFRVSIKKERGWSSRDDLFLAKMLVKNDTKDFVKEILIWVTNHVPVKKFENEKLQQLLDQNSA